VMFAGEINKYPAIAAALDRNPDAVNMGDLKDWLKLSRKQRAISSPRAVQIIRDAEKAVAESRRL